MGEYAVMHGADAICMPLETGQELLVVEREGTDIHWKWSYEDRLLADFYLEKESLEPYSIEVGDPQWVINLIQYIRLQNPQFLKKEVAHLHFVNHFPPQWGLGSSAATISSLCRLASVNPYLVNQKLMGGSGADIACTTAENWFLYRNKMPRPLTWDIPVKYQFQQNTFFVYSGRKQQTAAHLQDVKKNTGSLPGVSWQHANDFVYRFIAAATLPELLKIIYEHELLISDKIKMEPVGNQFPDFPGKIKSLGAWGGDFFMAVSLQQSDFVKEYFRSRGYDSVFGWDEFMETEKF